MKLLLILNDLDIGGSQNYTISLMNEFVDIGHEIELRVLSDNIPLKRRLNKEIKLKIWKRKSKLDFSVISEIRKEIKSNAYTCIIASYVLYQKLASSFLKNRITTIYPIHSTIHKSFKDYLFNYFIYRTARQNEIFLTSIDNQTKYLQEKYTLRPGFFKQVYNGVDTNKFTLPPEEFNRDEFLISKGVKASNDIILMVAGFREEKRHVDAIDAFLILSSKMNNISFVFVGDNRIEELNSLLNYTKKKDVSNIHFFPADEVGDIREFYWSSSIFTLTSNQVETFPISSLEAMASGLPCVLTNIGGAKDIVENEKNGFIVEPENIESINKGWAKCLEITGKSKSDEIRSNIVANYSIKTSAKKYLELISRCNVSK